MFIFEGCGESVHVVETSSVTISIIWDDIPIENECNTHSTSFGEKWAKVCPIWAGTIWPGTIWAGTIWPDTIWPDGGSDNTPAMPGSGGGTGGVEGGEEWYCVVEWGMSKCSNCVGRTTSETTDDVVSWEEKI